MRMAKTSFICTIAGLLLLLFIGYVSANDVIEPELEWFDKGYTAEIRSNYEQAIKYYDEAIRLNPDFALAYFHRGVSYYYYGKYQQAIENYTKALSFQQPMSEKCVSLLEKYRESYDGDYSPSCKRGWDGYNKETINSIKKTGIKLNKLSKLDYFVDKPKGIVAGRKLLEKIKFDLLTLELMPDFGVVYYNLGIAYGKQGKKELLFDNWRKAENLGYQVGQDNTNRLQKKWEGKPWSKKNKITHEMVNYINSFTPAQRQEFGTIFTLMALDRYISIVDRHPKNAVFFHGWVNRMQGYIQ